MALFSRFRSDRGGVSAVEFALVAPVLAILYMGLGELCNAMLAQNRLQHAASTMGDLVAQASAPSLANVSDDFAAAAAVMAPLPVNSLKMRVTSVVADATTGKTTVGWSQVYGGMSQPAGGAAINVSPIVVPPGGSIIQAEAQYTFTPNLPFINKTGYPFDQVFYLSPRQTTVIPPPT